MKKNKNMILIFISIFTLIGCGQTQGNNDLTSENILTSKNILESSSIIENESIIEIVDSGLAEPQLDITFPIETSSDEYDSRILTTAISQFTFFENQGYILISPESTETFDIYVNGKNLNIKEWQNGAICKIDISSYTVNGNNSLQVTNIQGTNASVKVEIPYPEVIDSTKNYINDDTFNLIDSLIEAEVANGFPSAQLVVIKDGKLVKNTSYGYINNYTPDGTPLSHNEKMKVTNDTLFDLASNTKMYATNYSIQKLVSEEKLNIDQKINDFFPDFIDRENDAIKGKEQLTIRDLLTHQAGFPSGIHYHNELDEKYDGNMNGKNDLFSQDKATTKEMIFKTPLIYEPRTETLYTDVDYMLLGLIVEEVSGQNLDEYVKESFYQPLNLKLVTFNPLENKFKKEEVAATELRGNTRDGIVNFKNIRTDVIQGEVHDEKAFYSMGGVSGHAGLFSNANDLAKLAQIMLNGGGYGSNKFFDKTVIERFVKPTDKDDTYALGWRREGASKEYSWAFSPLADASTVGHTGWTGTLTVIDPVENMVIVLLTSAKNSPVLNKEDKNTMLGNKYFTSTYGLISTLVFSSFEKNMSSEINDSKLIELVTQKENQIKELPELWDNKPSRLSYNALLDVLEERKSESQLIQTYLKNNDIKEMRKFAQE